MLWVVMSDGGFDEVVAEARTIDEARAAFAAALRREADDRDESGEADADLYRLSADAVEQHWTGALNEDFEVGYGAGIAEEPPLSDREFQEMQRRCHETGGEDCDIVPTYTTWTVTDRDPDDWYRLPHRDDRMPKRAPRRWDDDNQAPPDSANRPLLGDAFSAVVM